MARRSRARLRQHRNHFIPTQALLGYPKGYEQEAALRERRREYAVFSRKLHAVLTPVLAGHYALHEELLVLTTRGLSGPMARIDAVAVTTFGVFVISRFHATGKVSIGQKANELRISGELGTSETVHCPLWQSAPAVHFLGALLSELQCPIETIAIADNDACEFAFGLSTALLKLEELHHFLRQRHERAAMKSRFFNVRDISARLITACQDWQRAVNAA